MNWIQKQVHKLLAIPKARVVVQPEKVENKKIVFQFGEENYVGFGNSDFLESKVQLRKES